MAIEVQNAHLTCVGRIPVRLQREWFHYPGIVVHTRSENEEKLVSMLMLASAQGMFCIDGWPIKTRIYFYLYPSREKVFTDTNSTSPSPRIDSSAVRTCAVALLVIATLECMTDGMWT